MFLMDALQLGTWTLGVMMAPESEAPDVVQVPTAVVHQAMKCQHHVTCRQCFG